MFLAFTMPICAVHSRIISSDFRTAAYSAQRSTCAYAHDIANSENIKICAGKAL